MMMVVVLIEPPNPNPMISEKISIRTIGDAIPIVENRKVLNKRIKADAIITGFALYLTIALAINTEDRSQETAIGADASPDIVAS
jgi:hypothetical protein